MKKLLICALALGGFAVSAQAADLNGVSSSGGYKDEPASGFHDPLPDALTYKGVTLYGTVDIGYAYQTNGMPFSGAFYTGLNYANQKLSQGSVSAFTNNSIEQSKIGVKVQEDLGYGVALVGKVETGFDPAGGELADACLSVKQAAGYSLAGHSPAAYNDGGRCGQVINGDWYGGLSNASYGTLTAGRQSSLVNEGIGTYDPNHGAYAFSLIGYSGGALGGVGTTETTRWDNSAKYVYQYGPLHGAVMYSWGGQDTSIFGDAYGANIGGTYKGLSIDAYYEKENAVVGISPSATAINTLSGTVTNNEAWVLMSKYTYDLGGGFKDEGPSGKLTFFGGYAHIDMSNPDHLQNYYNGYSTLNGYGVTLTSAANAFGSDKILQTEWVGASYETGKWTFTGAYYHENQNTYLTVAGAGCTTGSNVTKVNGVNVSNAIQAASNCSGDINFGSFVVDYRFDKHFDVYAGVSTDAINGGLGSGYLANTNTSVVTGLRMKF